MCFCDCFFLSPLFFSFIVFGGRRGFFLFFPFFCSKRAGGEQGSDEKAKTHEPERERKQGQSAATRVARMQTSLQPFAPASCENLKRRPTLSLLHTSLILAPFFFELFFPSFYLLFPKTLNSLSLSLSVLFPSTSRSTQNHRTKRSSFFFEKLKKTHRGGTFYQK